MKKDELDRVFRTYLNVGDAYKLLITKLEWNGLRGRSRREVSTEMRFEEISFNVWHRFSCLRIGFSDKLLSLFPYKVGDQSTYEEGLCSVQLNGRARCWMLDWKLV
jgi:hypothetical protein